MNKEKISKIVSTLVSLLPLALASCMSFTLCELQSMKGLETFESLAIIGIGAIIMFLGLICTLTIENAN